MVEAAVLRRLKAEKVSLAKLKKGEARRDPLSEDLALAMGLLFKLLAPMRNVAAIETSARGIEAMAREEAAGDGDAPQEPPPGAGGAAVAAEWELESQQQRWDARGRPLEHCLRRQARTTSYNENTFLGENKIASTIYGHYRTRR